MAADLESDQFCNLQGNQQFWQNYLMVLKLLGSLSAREWTTKLWHIHLMK